MDWLHTSDARKILNEVELWAFALVRLPDYDRLETEPGGSREAFNKAVRELERCLATLKTYAHNSDIQMQ